MRLLRFGKMPKLAMTGWDEGEMMQSKSKDKKPNLKNPPSFEERG